MATTPQNKQFPLPNAQTPKAAMALYDYLVEAGQIKPTESREAVLEFFQKEFQAKSEDSPTQ